MKKFHYEGRDITQQLMQGVIETDTMEQVAEELFKKNITPIRITPIKEKFRIPMTWHFKVSSNDLLTFCKQMQALIKAGVPIISAVTRLAEILPNPLWVKTLQHVAKQLTAGASLSSALQQHPRLFSSLLVALVKAGEANGRLDTAFAQAAQHYELETSTRRRVKNALRYPIFVILTVCFAVGIMNIFVIPKFALLYSGFHATLPLPTRILIKSSTLMREHLWILLICLLLGVISWIYALKKPRIRLRWDAYQLKLPIFGSLLLRITLATFTRSLAMLLQTGVSLLHALTLTAHIVRNTYAREKILNLRKQIEAGMRLSVAAEQAHFFSPLVIQMMAVGEEAGNVDTMLLEVSQFYEQEVDYEIKQLADKMEPILLLLVGGIVLVLALGVFLPMWNMVYIVK